MSLLKRVCVFCASATKVDDVYFKEAKRLGEILAVNNIAMNYGGGAVGLMGEIADSMLKNDGVVTGIIPRFMVEVEWEHKGVKDMIHVETMAERKERLIEDVDAVITLPGSTGTLEELFDVLSAKKLGLFTKPVILVNASGFFNPLIEMLQKVVDENFMHKENLKIYEVVDSTEDVVKAIKNAMIKSEDAFNYSAM